MIGKTILTLWLAVLVVTPAPVFGLCGSLYLEYRRISPAFERAETELSRGWDRIMKTMPDREREELRQAQRAWVYLARDREAERLRKERGLAPAEAYAEATALRTAYLETLLPKAGPGGVAGRYSSGMGFLTVRELSGGRISFDLETDWPPQNCSGLIEGAEARLEGNTAVWSDPDCPEMRLEFRDGVVEITEKDHCGHHGLNCNFEGIYESVR